MLAEIFKLAELLTTETKQNSIKRKLLIGGRHLPWYTSFADGEAV